MQLCQLAFCKLLSVPLPDDDKGLMMTRVTRLMQASENGDKVRVMRMARMSWVMRVIR